MNDKILEALVGRSPELVALIWAIWYFGRKIEKSGAAIGSKLEKLTQAINELHSKIAVLLDRGERVPRS